MKTFRLITIVLAALMMAPQVVEAKTTKKKTTKKATTTKVTTPKVESKSYPLFDSSAAKRVWATYTSNKGMSQADYGSALDLCNIAYDYLNEDLQSIIKTYPTKNQRVKAYNNLDNGVGSEMLNFIESFSTKLHRWGAAGEFDHDNVEKTNLMLEKKQLYKDLLKQIFAN